MSKKNQNNVSNLSAVPAAGVMDIPLDLIVVDEDFNARKHGMDEESIAVFAGSIDEEGLIQPVVVEPMGEGKFFLKAGFRRYRAFQWLFAKAKEGKKAKEMERWASIKATVDVAKGKDDKEQTLNRYFTNIAENVARSNLTPFDLAMRCKMLTGEYDLSGTNIANRLGKNTGYINNLLNVVGEGRKGDGVIPEVLSRWQMECSWPEDDKRTKTCTTDWLNRCRKMDRAEQLAFLNRSIFISEGGDVEKYDAAQKAANGTGAGTGAQTTNAAQLVRPGRAILEVALENAKHESKTAKGERKAHLVGVVEGLKFALGVKEGLENRIKDVIVVKDGKVTQKAIKDVPVATTN